MQLNLSGFSTHGLLLMYGAIREALEADDNTPIGREKVYGTRAFPDWKEWEKGLSAELDSRKVKYQKVQW